MPCVHIIATDHVYTWHLSGAHIMVMWDLSQRHVFTVEIWGRVKQPVVCNVSVSVHFCVWLPLNDYYGLTPISQIESLLPGFFHSPGNGKENTYLLSLNAETLSFALTLTPSHPPKHTHTYS